MVDSSRSNTDNELQLSLDSGSSEGVNTGGDNKAVYSDEEVEKKREIAREKAERLSGVSNPITVTDGGEKGEKEEKDQNGKVPKEKQSIKFENVDHKPYEKYLKFFYLGLANVLVVMVFFLPLIFYYTDQPDNTTLINIPLNLDTCNATLSNNPGAFFEQAQSCSAAITPGCSMYPEECFCTPFLMNRARVANVSQVDMRLNPSIDLALDTGFRIADDALSSRLTSSDCRNKFLSFLCAHFVSPCNDTDPNAIAIQPTAQECKEIRDEVCSAEWKLLELSSYRNLIPNCSIYSDSDDFTDIRPNVVCNDQFGLYCDSLCLPLCKEFSQNSDGLTLLQDILFIFAGVSSLVGGTIVIIISIYRRNSMFHFPSILIIYQTVCVMTISFFVLLPFPIGRGNSFCSRDSLIDAYENPTGYCQLSGFVIHASILMMHFFWIMHLFHMFTRLAFPMQSRNFDQSTYRHWIHIGEVGGGIIVAIIPPIGVAAASEYNVPSFPANYCVPEPRVAYYTELLPINIVLAIGVCFIVTIFWMLHQRDEIFKASSVTKNGKCKCNILELTTPEFKLLLLFSYYVLFGVLFLTTTTLIVRNYDNIYEALEQYAVCQANGERDSCDEIRDELDTLNYPGLLNTCYILMAILNITNLIFVLQFRDIKYQVKKLSVVARRLTIDRLGSTSVSQ